MFSIVAILFLSTIGATFALEYLPGVTKGDVFTYSSVGYFSSNDPNAICPSNVLDQNNTEWIRVRITNVTGGAVYDEITAHYKNNTEVTRPGYANWTAGSMVNFMMLAANLSANDKITPDGAATINRTVLRSYPSGERETSILDYTQVYGNQTLHQIDYFDKITGVPVEYHDESVLANQYNTTTVFDLKLTSSSVWTVIIPEFSSFLILPAIMIPTLFAAILLKRKNRTKQT